MLEILALVWLWRVNGANARAKGQSTAKYRILTFVLWFGFELLGSFAGMLGSSYLMPDEDPLMGSYIFGVVGAAFGGLLSYQLAKNCPQKNQNNMYVDTSMQNQNVQYGPNSMDELLQIPATVRIIEQLGGYGGEKDYFYLNGQPICGLAPGMGYNFKIRSVRNIITIGTPYCDGADTEHSVRFIASENGVIEVHAAAGKLVPELFKNYTSN